uniref:Uncharacterized protein n=1 Tax=Timema bartmani TaxID=61472 RepID=A0A7R9ENQ7_9NEOP|nr:unnamed protein product [Timema bartmani]
MTSRREESRLHQITDIRIEVSIVPVFDQLSPDSIVRATGSLGFTPFTSQHPKRREMERWSGKVALVTGASSGIGAAIAQELVRQGLKVVGLARRVERVEELAAGLKNAPGKLYAVKADIAKEEDIIAAFDWIKKNLGGVDILVNNAGLGTTEVLSNIGDASWRVLDVNVKGLCICTREALKSMKERGVNNGHIIHINSVLGHSLPNTIPVSIYHASKHAVTVLTEGLRRELVQLGSKTKITVCCNDVTNKYELNRLNAKYNGPQLTKLPSERPVQPLIMLAYTHKNIPTPSEGGPADFTPSAVKAPPTTKKKSANLTQPSVSPGLVETEIADALGPEIKERIFAHNPCLQAKDIADAVIYTLGTPPHVQVHEITIKPVELS